MCFSTSIVEELLIVADATTARIGPLPDCEIVTYFLGH